MKVKSKLSRAKRRGKPTQWREVVTVTETKISSPEGLPKRVPKGDKHVQRELRFVVDPNKLRPGIPVQEIRDFVKDTSAVGVGQTAGLGQANAQEPGDPTTPNVGGSPLTRVAMWPSQLDRLKRTKEGLGPASDRLMTMYNLARDQAGSYKSGQVEKTLGGVKTTAGEIRIGAVHAQGEAAEGVARSEKGAEAAQQGKTAKARMDGETSKMEASTGKLAAQKVEKPPPKEGGGLLDRAKNVLYNQTIGRIGDAVAGLQGWLTRTIGGWAMARSGLTKDELDMAGIETSMRADHQKDKQTDAQMKEAEAEAKQVDPAVAKLMEDATADEQLAIQAMVESQDFMRSIGEAQQTLDEAITEGTAYLTEVSPIVRHELETRREGKAIDAAYVAPVVGSAKAFEASVGGGDELATPAARDAIGELQAAKQAWPELDIGSGLAQIAAAQQRFTVGHAGLVRDAHAAGESCVATALGLVGTIDYGGVLAAAKSLEIAMETFGEHEQRAVDVYVANLDAILDAHVQLIESAIDQHVDERESTALPANANAVPAPTPAAVQRKPAGATAETDDDPASIAARGFAGTATALPHGDTIQRAFGRHDVSGVQAHVGGPAAAATEQLGATAYASGDRVAFGAAPDLHTAAHEAAHVIQQQQGVSDEAVDEQHADSVADAVVAGESAEDLLSARSPGGGSAQLQRKAAARTAGKTEPAAPALDPADADNLARAQLYVSSVPKEWQDLVPGLFVELTKPFVATPATPTPAMSGSPRTRS